MGVAGLQQNFIDQNRWQDHALGGDTLLNKWHLNQPRKKPDDLILNWATDPNRHFSREGKGRPWRLQTRRSTRSPVLLPAHYA